MITGHCHCYQIVEKHERIIFNSLYEYVEENKLLSTRGVFLDMPKAFALIEPQGSILVYFCSKFALLIFLMI